MRNRLGFAALLLPITIPWSSGTAQQIRGVITDSAAGTPVSGAVVLLLDTAGETLARAISGINGEYGIFARTPPAVIRVRRLGFRPRDTNLPAPLPARFDVRLTRIPTLMQPVQVAVAANCPRRADREAALGLLEQARAGLLTAVVARSVSPASSMTRLDFRRWMHGTSDRVDSMTVTFDSVGRVTGSYQAVKTAREFLRDGFVFDDGKTAHYFAPDADVLLDDGFGQGYCFHLRRDAARANQLGLAFLPARRARNRVDVDGTLWVDTLARELREIEFKYLGLPAISDDAKPGGRLGFWTMANGLVLIDSWHLRWPRVEAETTHNTSPGRPQMRVWVNAIEAGGEVARAAWADSTTFAGALGVAQGRALGRDGRGVGNLVIRLRGTDYIATPDAAGNFEIADLVPGPYIADVIDPAISHLGIVFPTALRFTAQRDSVSQVRLLAPSTDELVIRNCTGRSWPAPTYAPGLLNVMVTSGGKPMPTVKWEIRRQVGGDWQYVVERRQTGEDGVLYTCLRYTENDEVEIRVWGPDEKFHYTKVEIGRRGAPVEIKLPPPAPPLRHRPSVDRRRGCASGMAGESCGPPH